MKIDQIVRLLQSKVRLFVVNFLPAGHIDIFYQQIVEEGGE